ncbi:tetratricopeptide repeat protein [Bradyrhizobium sediminis]|uniref:Tetratricopeptide repeat protein n=1 Tax=Bradyrhizobium sediminis TaxID=2840469 RepID=A0A975P146_9BRAD|nr:tetratricopeptide repeat protein [Bradyrhizobium sediminis]QWG25187.1 tetratricopeptide repeat protein [Bradyrhizobium sediminis]
MARTAAAGIWSRRRACARTAPRCPGGTSRLAAGLAWLAAGLVLFGLTSPGSAQTEPVRGAATFSAAGGYARLVLKLAEDVESDVSTAGSILVIRFKRPVDIPVEKLSDAVPDYVGSARRDPDGSAIRLSLARRVTINTMTAGERVFVDLLPDTWSGPPPALPAEVVRELSERARAAERALRQQRAAALAQKRLPIRVRASVQPTFVRFVFEMPDGVGVSSVLNDQKLSLLFNAALNFDLADAKLAAPSNVASIDQKIEGDTSAVQVALIGDVDVHSFREEKNYIIDVAFQQPQKPPSLPSPAPDASHAPATAAPATIAPAAKPVEPPGSRQVSEIVPPTSEMIAKQAKIEINPEAAPKSVPAPESPQPAPPSNEVSREAPPAAEAPAKMASVASEPAPEVKAPQAIQAQPVVQAPPVAQAPSAVQAPPAAAAGEAAAIVSARRDSDGLRLTFAFATATPAAAFRRADTVWLVFDTMKPIDIEPIRSKGGALLGDVSRIPLDKGQAIRIRLNRPQMPSLSGDDQGGSGWTLTFADTMQAPPQPLVVVRNITDPALANVTVPLSRPGLLHRLTDPDAGDTLLVVTAPLPVRGFIKRHDFVEMSLLESIHGVAIHPNSEDVRAEVAPDKVIIGRPGGLTLSSADSAAERATTAVRPIFDVAEWRKNQAEDFITRRDALIAAAGALEPGQRTQARLNLARFYMSRGMYPEARGAADLALADVKSGSEDPIALMVRAVASIAMGRPEQGLKELANPAIGSNYDSQLWKALGLARQGKWSEAREKFKNVEFAITSLPIELQRIVISEAMRASLEVRDFSGAAKRGSDLQVVGIPPEMKPAMAVLHGRLAEALGHDKDAEGEYKAAIESSDRAAAAEARLLNVFLRQRREEISQADVLRELETLSVTWRGDAVEIRALQTLARIYTDTGRFAESLAAAKTATKMQPNSEISRAAQDAAATLFAQIYLSPKGDDLPPVDALAMFYEFRELTPIGRRGDEMIRRLADRLVGVDLLDQAAELLQYQIDRRLEGAARAQVAARLAMVYLTNRKPDRAISALHTTRIADLSGELRQQRLLLEARAQSDVGRRDLALDIISNIGGREAIRLRSDIYWASRRWREASEQIELYYADRWRDFKPLNAVEKGDVIRAVVGYALAEDAIGLARFREKYAPLMSGEADRAAFETASTPAAASSAEFAAIAKMAASVDTLDGFLREMKTRFPDATARAPLPPGTAKGEPVHTGSLPRIIGLTRADAKRW